MTEASRDDLIRAEQEKRDAHWDAAERWRILQETITWADGQAAGGRNTRQRCLELQRAKLAGGDR